MREKSVRRYVVGIVVITVGLILIFVSNSISSSYTLFDVPAGAAHTGVYVTAAVEKFWLLVAGILSIVAGPIVTAYSSRAHKRLENWKSANPERNARYNQY